MVTVATDAKRSRGALGLKKRLGPTSGSDLALRPSQPGTPRSAERNVAEQQRNSLSVSCGEQIKFYCFPLTCVKEFKFYVPAGLHKLRKPAILDWKTWSMSGEHEECGKDIKHGVALHFSNWDILQLSYWGVLWGFKLLMEPWVPVVPAMNLVQILPLFTSCPLITSATG